MWRTESAVRSRPSAACGALVRRAWKVVVARPVPIACTGLMLVVLAAAATSAETPATSRTPPRDYVGAQACAACHQTEYALWRTSDHAQAMQEATAATVRGNFDHARLTYAGVTSTFFTRDGKFYINTDGPDGALRDYLIRYTFGVDP